MVFLSSISFAGEPTMKALIIEGQNNHGVWPKTSQMMKRYLEQTSLFAVDIVRTAAEGTDPDFQPDFSQYQVVVSNYNGAPWPPETQRAFMDYVAGGGGFVVVHAANNSFGDWKEYNDMIGLGGWGGRNENTGPYVYLDDKGQLIRNSDPGPGGSHGAQHEFLVVTRDDAHPITRGMPGSWMHAQDELYDRLRGPGEQMTILATAYADPAQGGTGRHEPMMMVVEYGKGRVFHTPMGHGDYSQECVGFIVALQRGAEWAATGDVTQDLPKDFPTADKVSQRKFAE
jgi:type 1 glutamine amidotransferase